MTNTLDVNQLKDNDFRKTLPRYQHEYADNNMMLAAGFAQIAAKKSCTPSQLALAWVLAQGEHLIPIPGTKRRKYLIDNAGAAEIFLNAEDIAEIEHLLAEYPNTGARYNERNNRLVDKN